MSPGATPRYGIAYPTPGDPVTNYPATAQQAAQTVETALTKLLAGAVTVAGTNVATTPSVHVTFPAGRFTGPPVVVLQPYATSAWDAGMNSLTKDGMNVYGFTRNGNPATTGGFTIYWHALPGQSVRAAAALEDDDLEDDDDGALPLEDGADSG